jgi:hypothetical protein
MAAAGVETLIAPYAGPGGRSAWKGEVCVLSKPDQLTKRIALEDCTLGDFDSARRRVLVAGNSAATAFLPAFDRLVADDGYAVTVTAAWGAPPAPGLPSSGAWGAAHRHYWDDLFPALVERLRPGDIVLMISNLSGYAPEDAHGDTRQLTQFEDALAKLSAQLQRRGVRLVVLNAIPYAHEAECEPVVAVKQWFAPFGGPCLYHSREDTLRRRAPLDAVLARLQAAGRIEVVDLMDVFCPGGTCTYVSLDGQVLYRDATGHPSVEAAWLSAPALRDALRREPVQPRP